MRYHSFSWGWGEGQGGVESSGRRESAGTCWSVGVGCSLMVVVVVAWGAILIGIGRVQNRELEELVVGMSLIEVTFIDSGIDVRTPSQVTNVGGLNETLDF